MGTGQVRIAEQALHLVAFEPGAATGRFHQPVYRLDAHLHGIALVGAPECQGGACRVLVALAVFGDLFPAFFQQGPCGGDLMRGLGQAHECRRCRAHRSTGVGAHAVAGFLAEHRQHALGDTKADGGETTGKIGAVRGEEDLAVRVQAKACRLALHHVLGLLDAVLRHEGVTHDQGLAAAATHADGIPIITDLIIAARQNGEAVVLGALCILPAEPHDRPLGMVATGAPAHFTAEGHAAFDLFGTAKGRDAAAGRCIRVGLPHLLLQLGREHRHLVAVGAQQAHGPGGAGAGACQRGDALGKLRQRNLHAAVMLWQEGAMHADAFEQRDILCRDTTILLRAHSIGGNRRQDRREVFQQGVWLFHERSLVIG
ncbi:hypothetical protein D3C76_382110 [compost metagenome]